MNLRDLEYIRAVARQEHFGHAAEVCHISQPALSTQVRKLENELGVTLFERDNRSVRVTEIGAKIIALAEEALTVVDAIRLTAKTAHDPLSGELAVGSIPTVTPYLIPHFVTLSQEQLPQLRLKFREEISARLNRALLEGSLDAAILATPPADPRLDAMELYDEDFWVVLPRGHALEAHPAIDIDDLPVDELLLLAEGHCFRDQTLDLLHQPHRRDADDISATSLETLVNMVVAGQGITLAPAMALSGSWTNDHRIGIRRLTDNSACRRIYLTYRKSFPRKILLEKLAALVLERPPTCTELRQTSTARVSGACSCTAEPAFQQCGIGNREPCCIGGRCTNRQTALHDHAVPEVVQRHRPGMALTLEKQ